MCMFAQGKQEEADEVKRKFAGDSRSDHIALLNAYKVHVFLHVHLQLHVHVHVYVYL